MRKNRTDAPSSTVVGFFRTNWKFGVLILPFTSRLPPSSGPTHHTGTKGGQGEVGCQIPPLEVAVFPFMEVICWHSPFIDGLQNNRSMLLTSLFELIIGGEDVVP